MLLLFYKFNYLLLKFS